jgi:hypothetical protein
MKQPNNIIENEHIGSSYIILSEWSGCLRKKTYSSYILLIIYTT